MIADAKYMNPTTAKEAVEMASANAADFTFVAGGTDIMANRFMGNETHSCIIDISGIEQLKGVREEDDKIIIGPLETLADIESNKLISKEFPGLIEAARSVASPVIRESATIGGNILCENRCMFYNQSDWWKDAIGFCLKSDGDICIATGGKKSCFSEFVSDVAPMLICYNASITIAEENGEKDIQLESIYTGNGVFPRDLPKLGIITGINVPKNSGKHFFKKLRQRESLEFTSLTIAAVSDPNGFKIALSGVDPKPVIVEGDLDMDVELIIKKALKGARAVDNDAFSRNYRREMIDHYIREAFEIM